MKLLSIEDGKGYFLAASGEFGPLDQITKEDLLRLVELTLTTDPEMDDYNPSLLLNQAHQIIYENLWSRLCDLGRRRKEFLDESKRLYLAEYERYRGGSHQPTEADEPDAQVGLPGETSGS